MRTGVILGILANLLWGLAILVPVLLDVSGLALTAARSIIYGLVSLLAVAVTRTSLRLPAGIWRTALGYTFVANPLYYLFVVSGIGLVGGPVITVLIGVMPVTVALWGWWLNRDVRLADLLASLGLIGVGLIAVNIAEIDWSGSGEHSLGEQLVGVLAGLAALVSWTWFAVANARFLREHREISPGTWTSLMGVATLPIGLLLLPVVTLTGGWPGQGAWPRAWAGLAAGGLILGVGISWLSISLWNHACARLPVSLAGQLIVFETLSGLSYVFLATRTMPPLLELAGIALVVAGVLIAIRKAHRTPPPAQGYDRHADREAERMTVLTEGGA